MTPDMAVKWVCDKSCRFMLLATVGRAADAATFNVEFLFSLVVFPFFLCDFRVFLLSFFCAVNNAVHAPRFCLTTHCWKSLSLGTKSLLPLERTFARSTIRSIQFRALGFPRSEVIFRFQS